jgi:hypothetical protein
MIAQGTVSGVSEASACLFAEPVLRMCTS